MAIGRVQRTAGFSLPVFKMENMEVEEGGGVQYGLEEVVEGGGSVRDMCPTNHRLPTPSITKAPFIQNIGKLHPN